MSFSESRPLENQSSRKVALSESRGPGTPPVKSPSWKVALLESRRPGIRHPMTSPLGKSPSRKARPPGKSPSWKVAPSQSQPLGKLSSRKVTSESHPPEKPRPRKAALTKTRLPGKTPFYQRPSSTFCVRGVFLILPPRDCVEVLRLAMVALPEKRIRKVAKFSQTRNLRKLGNCCRTPGKSHSRKSASGLAGFSRFFRLQPR